MQKLDQAEGALEQALDIRPDEDFALTQLGRVRALRNDLPGAIDLLQRAARSNPESPEPHYFLAGIYFAQGSKSDFLREKAAFERLRVNTPMPGVMELPDASGS
jgi:tetratricopeptide (TPR) repeat protein